MAQENQEISKNNYKFHKTIIGSLYILYNTGKSLWDLLSSKNDILDKISIFTKSIVNLGTVISRITTDKTTQKKHKKNADIIALIADLISAYSHPAIWGYTRGAHIVGNSIFNIMKAFIATKSLYTREFLAGLEIAKDIGVNRFTQIVATDLDRIRKKEIEDLKQKISSLEEEIGTEGVEEHNNDAKQNHEDAKDELEKASREENRLWRLYKSIQKFTLPNNTTSILGELPTELTMKIGKRLARGYELVYVTDGNYTWGDFCDSSKLIDNNRHSWIGINNLVFSGYTVVLGHRSENGKMHYHIYSLNGNSGPVSKLKLPNFIGIAWYKQYTAYLKIKKQNEAKNPENNQEEVNIEEKSLTITINQLINLKGLLATLNKTVFDPNQITTWTDNFYQSIQSIFSNLWQNINITNAVRSSLDLWGLFLFSHGTLQTSYSKRSFAFIKTNIKPIATILSFISLITTATIFYNIQNSKKKMNPGESLNCPNQNSNNNNNLQAPINPNSNSLIHQQTSATSNIDSTTPSSTLLIMRSTVATSNSDAINPVNETSDGTSISRNNNNVTAANSQESETHSFSRTNSRFLAPPRTRVAETNERGVNSQFNNEVALSTIGREAIENLKIYLKEHHKIACASRFLPSQPNLKKLTLEKIEKVIDSILDRVNPRPASDGLNQAIDLTKLIHSPERSSIVSRIRECHDLILQEANSNLQI